MPAKKKSAKKAMKKPSNVIVAGYSVQAHKRKWPSR